MNVMDIQPIEISHTKYVETVRVIYMSPKIYDIIYYISEIYIIY